MDDSLRPRIESIERLVSSLGLDPIERRNKGSFQTGGFALASILFNLKEVGIISEEDIFFDLGAGEGLAVFLASILGFNSFGAELDPDLAKVPKVLAEKLMEESLIGENNVVNIVEGSYFLEDYILMRERGVAIAPHFEEKDMIKLYGSASFNYHHRFGDRFFSPLTTNPSVYGLCDLSFSDIKIFFSYTWGIELPSQLEQFARFSSPESIFINHTSAHLQAKDKKELLEELGLVQRDLLPSGWQDDRGPLSDSYRQVYKRK